MFSSPFAAVVEASVVVLCAVAATHYEEEDRGIVFDSVRFVFEPAVEPSPAYRVEFGHAPPGISTEIDFSLVGCVGALGAV